MEKKGLIGGRSWGVMQIRFQRTLIKNIKAGKENYGLTEREISLFRGEGKVDDGGEKEGESTDSDDDDDEKEEEMDIDVEEEEGDIDEPEVEEKDDEKGEEGDEQGENEEEIDRPLPSRILVDF